MSGTPELSVVVAVRNGATLIGGLLDALRDQSVAAEMFETIIADDGSEDGTPAILRDWAATDPDRRRVVFATGLGPAAARNAAARAARGNWIVFTDADVVPEERWLEEIYDATRQSSADGLEGAVVPWPPESVGPYTHQVANLDGGKFVTANMSYRRELFETLGGFDERFRDPFLEDSDLAFRALDYGAELQFVPSVRVRHRVLPVDARRAIRAARFHRWLPLLAAKHPQRIKTFASVQRLTRPEAHLLGAAAGVGLSLTRSRASRLAGAVLVLNGIRVARSSGRLHGPARLVPGQVLIVLCVPVVKVASLLEGAMRFRNVRP